MFSFFKKLNGLSNAQEHAGRSGGQSHSGGCCGGGGHAYEEHGSEADAASLAAPESPTNGSTPIAEQNQHAHA
jgi:hypothetical protein